MDFYTNVARRGERIYVTGYSLGMRVREVVDYEPYLFVPDPNGQYGSVDGRKLRRVDFQNIRAANKFCESYPTESIYGLRNYEYVYLHDEFGSEIKYDPKLVNVTSLDIECGGDDVRGFPNIELADQPITAITMHSSRGKTVTFGVKPYVVSAPNHIYIHCESEVDMLEKFLQVWSSDAWMPDVVTGYNIEWFDIPYIVNRIRAVLGEAQVKRLSPWGIVTERVVEFRGKENRSYGLFGLSVLDYYQLYRKFSFTNHETYKLDYIAQIELGERKIDYSQYGSLNDLYRENPQLYIDYNYHDVMLVKRLDDKLGFIELVMAMAYRAGVNYSDTMSTVRPWDVIIHNHLIDRGIAVSPIVDNDAVTDLAGGYVKEPRLGMSRWVVSLDLDSLYPHLIMQYNISPETYVGRMPDSQSVESLVTDGLNADTRSAMERANRSLAANGAMYRRDVRGFLPELMDSFYAERKRYKKLMLEAKRRYEQTKSPEDEILISRYHNIQLALKIQLNSAYGALANRFFRWFSFDNAEAITKSGQLSIRWIETRINRFLNSALGTVDADYVIASDTDSLYLDMSELVGRSGLDGRSRGEVIDALDKLIEAKLQPFIDRSYDELASMMNAYEQRMHMKRETIADKAFWKAAKAYVMNALDVEGVRYEKPKLKMTGIEAVRSSTPHVCRDAIRDGLEIVMNGTQEDLWKHVSEFSERFMSLPFHEVAFPRGVTDVGKWMDRESVYRKGTPQHVKAALIHNHLLRERGVVDYKPIVDGDKIRFSRLRVPNPIGVNVIACHDELPSEFGLDKYVDNDAQLTKAFLEPLASITNVIGWTVQKRDTLDDWF
jgi:DNA polymerase elongation subunit (family B)